MSKLTAAEAIDQLAVKGVPLPPKQLMFMPEDHLKMLQNGLTLLGTLDRFGLYRDELKVLDIGCGYGRLAYALLARQCSGPYAGYEILAPHVEWLTTNLLPHLPQGSQFTHMDVASSRYRPGHASAAASSARLPAPPFEPDLITLFSVFTHLYPDDISNYLRQITGFMTPATRLVCTWFWRLPDVLELEREGRSPMPMKHRHSEHCWYFDEKDPLWAISYDWEWVERQVLAAGLTVEQTLAGSWCGRRGATVYQDTLILGRSH
jgi:SAM-dependent methyltransferase